jgi:hypothetical protein
MKARENERSLRVDTFIHEGIEKRKRMILVQIFLLHFLLAPLEVMTIVRIPLSQSKGYSLSIMSPDLIPRCSSSPLTLVHGFS